VTDLSDDLLYGVPEIANFTGLPARQIYHLLERGLLPAFKVGDKKGSMWCSRKSSLARHMDGLEAKHSATTVSA
jgi:hypothetical protein